MNNPFGTQTQAAYDLWTLTQAIEKADPSKKYIGFLDRKFPGLFNFNAITTLTFGIEQIDRTLKLLTSQPRGGPAPKMSSDKRKVRDFRTYHYPVEDVLKPEELQGVRAFGSEGAPIAESYVYNSKLAKMRNALDLTIEWLKMGAINGIVKDGDNSDMVSLFTEFGITEKVIDFDLDDTATNVNAKCREVVNYMEDSLRGDSMSGIGVLCSRTFYDALIGHPKVEEAFKYFSTTQELSRDHSKEFTFGGLTFVPHGGSVTDSGGNARKFVADNYARAFPLGGTQTFLEVYAPGDFMETVNTPGLRYYAKEEIMEFNRGKKLHAQTNPFMMCAQPELLVKIGMNID